MTTQAERDAAFLRHDLDGLDREAEALAGRRRQLLRQQRMLVVELGALDARLASLRDDRADVAGRLHEEDDGVAEWLDDDEDDEIEDDEDFDDEDD